MATNDVNLQVINSMTQDKMNSLKDANGKIPSLANQIIMTDEEDVNLSQFRTEVVYDMSSSDANKNWGYPNGIQGGVTVSGKDFSKYEKLIVYVNLIHNITAGFQLIYEIDLTYTSNSENKYSASMYGISSASKDMGFSQSYVNAEKNSFTHSKTGYNQITEIRSDSIVYKIEGILKTPAMIYTGAELNAGGGISINNGTISSLLKGVMCRQTKTDQPISWSSYTNIKYNRLVSSIGSGITYSNGNFVVGDGVTCIKFTICCNFYNMSGVSYLRVLPKKNGTLTGDELWYFHDSGHSGGFSQTIMFPCQSGDSFTLDGMLAADYTGYLNGNSYITVEVF